MYSINKYNSNKATVCTNKVCITVYDETARIVNAIIISVVFIAAVAAIAKAVK